MNARQIVKMVLYVKVAVLLRNVKDLGLDVFDTIIGQS